MHRPLTRRTSHRVTRPVFGLQKFRLPHSAFRAQNAFTLIELLVVITIIAVLIGLLFPVFGGAQNQAKKVQAKNDEVQIVTAVNAFYTDYGKYPIDVSAHGNSDVLYGDPGGSYHNSEVIDAIRGGNLNLNPRAVAFLQAANVKDKDNPRGGIATQDVSQNGWMIKTGAFVDPWGGEYLVAIDGSYDGIATLYVTYSDIPTTANAGCIAWSFGKDNKKGTADDGKYIGSDDVLSWQ